MKETKKFAFDVSWVYISIIIRYILLFFLKPIMVFYLGANEYGIWVMVITIYSLFTLIGAVGIHSAITKYVAEYKIGDEKIYRTLSCSIINLIIFGLLISTVLFFSSNLLADIFKMPSLAHLIRIIAFIVPIDFVSLALVSMLQGLRKMKLRSFWMIFSNGLKLCLVTAFLIIGLGIEGAVFGWVLSIIISFLLIIILCRDVIYHLTLQGYKQESKKLIRFGLAILTVGGINMITYNSDKILIGYFRTNAELAYYAIAIAIAEMIWLVPNGIMQVTYPAISTYWFRKNHDAIEKMVLRSVKYTTCVLLVLALAIVFFAQDIVPLLFGTDFETSVLPIQILLVGAVFVGGTRSVGAIFASIGKLDLVVKIPVTVAITNVILNIILIPSYGIIGAAIATSSSFILQTSLRFYYKKKLLGINFGYKWYIKIGILTLGAITSYYLLEQFNHFIVGGIVLAIYSIVIWLYFLSEKDREYFAELLKTSISYLTKSF